MSLYNCRHADGKYRITKFDEHMNVEASYIVSRLECDCPAGKRPTCRHRQMLPKFLQRGTVGTNWWYDFDRGGWVQMGEDESPSQGVEPTQGSSTVEQGAH